MNFRTTIFLLILVVIVGVSVFFINNRENKPTETTTNEHKLIDLDTADVTRVVLTPGDGKAIVLEKKGNDWRLVQPVQGAADQFKVDDLIRAVTGLQSRGQVGEDKKTSGGLDHPAYTVELTTKAGKTQKLLVGDKPPVGDTMLVIANANSKPDVVNASFFTQLDKKPSDFRKTQLVDTPSTDIKQLTVTKGKNTIRLEKEGNDWKITEPKAMPADTSAVTDLVLAITGLNAQEFVSDDAAKAPSYGLTHPKVTVWYSTQAPTTQPSATQPTTRPAGDTLRFGDYEDVLKKNVFAEIDNGPIVTVPATSENSFNKTPLDLRNKEVVTIDPAKVQSFTIAIDRPAATQPTSRPAEIKEFTIEHRKVTAPVLGPTLPAVPATQPSTQVATTQPTTQATTQVATTQPTTQPSVAATQPSPQAPWFFASGGQGDAEEGQVKALLDSLHPLRVEKYLESAPATQPAGTYVLTVHTSDGASFVLRFTDPGSSGRLTGSYYDLVFEVDRSLLDKLTGDFKTKKPEVTPPPSFGGGAPIGG
jgi:hypothetical protein